MAARRADTARVVYISQGDIPSKWAHTFQAMKMADALAARVRKLTLLTAGSLLPAPSDRIDLPSWYGVSGAFESLVFIPNAATMQMAVHYGELPERPAALAEVRAAWRRVREAAGIHG